MGEEPTMATGKAVDQGPGMVLLNGFLVRGCRLFAIPE